MNHISPKELARYIDHTLLKADAVEGDIIKLCEEAVQNNFATVCIQPCWVKLAREQLKQYPSIGITTVIGFPLGANTSSVKAFEARQAIMDGATEIDMVINIGLLKNGNAQAVEQDIAAVAEECKDQAVLKVILETGLLTDDEIVAACKLSIAAGANYVKTSTGFSKGGATTEHIALMRNTVGADYGVKASGGVRDYETAVSLIEAGASRIGASASIAIISGVANSNDTY